MRTSGKFFAVLVAVAALTGCATAAPVADAPTESPAAAVPGPPAQLVISPTGVAVRDASGVVLQSHDYLGDAAGFAAMITTATGVEPMVTAAECIDYGGGSFECFDGSYRWEQGGVPFILKELALPPDTPLEAPFTLLDVRVRTPTLGTLTIATSTGLTIGGSAADAVASLPADQNDGFGGIIWERVDTYTFNGESFAFGGYGTIDGAGVLTWIASPGTLNSWRY